MHQLLDGEPKVLNDPIAARLLSAEMLQHIQSHPGEAVEPRARRLRSHIVLRSRYAEDRLAAAARRGVCQCVMLGAGYDTFAYRQPDWACHMRLYEVDHPATQEAKRQRLAAADLPLPANLEFVAIDLESASLRGGLRASTLDFTEPVFFSCLGVLAYLTHDAVQATFQLVAAFPAGSEMVFTFAGREALASALAHRASLLGEPWHTYFALQTLGRDLLELGFSEIVCLSVDDAARTYFQGRTDGLPAPRHESIATAVRTA